MVKASSQCSRDRLGAPRHALYLPAPCSDCTRSTRHTYERLSVYSQPHLSQWLYCPHYIILPWAVSHVKAAAPVSRFCPISMQGMRGAACLQVSAAEAHSLGSQLCPQVCAGRLSPGARVDVQDVGSALLCWQGKQQLPIKPGSRLPLGMQTGVTRNCGRERYQSLGRRPCTQSSGVTIASRSGITLDVTRSASRQIMPLSNAQVSAQVPGT